MNLGSHRIGPFLVGLAVSSLILTWWVITSSHIIVRNAPMVEELRRTGAFNIAAIRSDDQFVAGIAADPLVTHPMSTGPLETAYRAGRPLASWLTWLAALGNRDRLTIAATLVGALGGGIAVAGVGALFERYSRSPYWGLSALVLPGAWLSVGGSGGTDLMALGLAAAGIVWWRPRPLLAAAALTLGCLAREDVLIVVAALAVKDLVDIRGVLNRTTRAVSFALRRALPPCAVWGGWVIYLRARLGAWPWQATVIYGRHRTGFGLPAALESRYNIPALILLAVLVVHAIWSRFRVESWIVLVVTTLSVAHVGRAIWIDFIAFTRVLIFAYVFGFIVFLTETEGSQVFAKSDPHS